jgi:large subunit ribosomal protein L10
VPPGERGNKVLNRSEKEASVEQLRADLEPDGHVVLTEYRGLTVEQMSRLRKQVCSASGTLKVMKNTLMRRAVEGTDKEVLGDFLTGPNALVYTKADPVAMVKVVADASKEYQAMEVKAGVVEGRQMTAAEIFRIAELPSRDELLGKMLGSLMSPVQGLANVLQGVPRKLVYALEAIRQAKEAEG